MAPPDRECKRTRFPQNLERVLEPSRCIGVKSFEKSKADSFRDESIAAHGATTNCGGDSFDRVATSRQTQGHDGMPIVEEIDRFAHKGFDIPGQFRRPFFD